MDLFGKEQIDFDHPYYSKHLITYIGNKRSLLPFLDGGFEFVKKN
jgi:hypothetical protein